MNAHPQPNLDRAIQDCGIPPGHPRMLGWVGTTALAMVIGGAYMVYDASQSTARKDERKSDLQQNARSALDTLLDIALNSFFHA